MCCVKQREKRSAISSGLVYVLHGKKSVSSFQSKVCLQYFNGKKEEIIIIISELA